MRKLLASNKGSSSILVVLLLVVLVVFGLAALTTALSSVRLGQKATQWHSDYYTVESQAQQRFAEIDKAVHAAFAAKGELEASLAKHLDALDFNIVTTTNNGEAILISYESWQGNMGVASTLELNPQDPGSLHIVKWQVIK